MQISSPTGCPSMSWHTVTVTVQSEKNETVETRNSETQQKMTLTAEHGKLTTNLNDTSTKIDRKTFQRRLLLFANEKINHFHTSL
jgi:hypothetical protein